MDWKTVAAQLISLGLPMIGTVIGGPIGGFIGSGASKLVAGALGVEATPEAISSAIASDPETAKVKLSEIDAASRADAEATKRLELLLADVANARQQTTALAQTGSSIAYGAPMMSALAIVSFVGFSVALFLIKSPDIPDKLYSLLSTGYGGVLIWVGQSYNYWLGSSDGSKRNADAIRTVATNQTIADRVGQLIGKR